MSLLAFGVEPFEDAIYLLLHFPNTAMEPLAVMGEKMDPESGYGNHVVLTPLGHRWRTRAAFHLQRRLDLELGNESTRVLVQSEAAALELIQNLGRALVAASAAMAESARRMRESGAGVHASRLMSAAGEARKLGEEVLQ